MSVIVPISTLTPTILRKLDKDLHVKPIPTLNTKGPLKTVEAFDTFKHKDQDVASIPFNYYYHHLENLEPVETGSFKEVKLKFEGNLLPRQKEVKDEVVEILNRTGSVVLSLHTGFGKTVMAIYLASKIKRQTIILCHR